MTNTEAPHNPDHWPAVGGPVERGVRRDGSEANLPRLSTGMEDWATPQDFFDRHNAEFGFTLDACATTENAKCGAYFTKEIDGLAQSWAGHRVWMNPPYGKDIPAWMAKAYRESQSGAELVVCLVPARTDTKWWHDFAEKGERRFVKGRLKFLSTDGPLRRMTQSVLDGRHAPNLGAPFPSVVVVFRAPNDVAERLP